MIPKWKPAAVSAALSLLFIAVYGTTNWFTSTRSAVGSVNFLWEFRIPFVPLFILPYMSIDLFFIGGPFLAKSNRELAVLAKRLAAAILIAGICFLLVPLKLAYPPAEVGGMLGLIFNNFRTLDPPFNQLPSLHIALCLILADLYLRHTRGPLRVVTAAWFALIFLSPIFTHQHHLLDILGGIALAAICMHLFSSDALRQPFTPNRRIALYYAGASSLLILLSFMGKPWTYLLLWPAFSTATVAFAYLFIGPGIYRKHAGRLSWTTWLLLWPVLLGQRLSLFYYARTAPPCSKLTERLWIGRQLAPREARFFTVAGIRAVLDLTCEFPEIRALRTRRYLQIPVLDLTAPTPAQIEEALAFLHFQTRHGVVYLHCKVGYSRTAVVAGAYLIASGAAASVEEAVALLERARPGIVIRPEAMRALRDYAGKMGVVVSSPQS